MSVQNAPVGMSALYGVALRMGARFTDVRGWLMPEVFTSVEVEIQAVREGVGLTDGSMNGKVMVEGVDAGAALEVALGVSGLEVGRGVASGQVWVYRLRQDRFFVHTSPGGEADVLNKLKVGSGGFVTATDKTCGLCEVRVIGLYSVALMQKVCGLNFRSEAFPDRAAQQSSVAKTNQIVVRRDLDGMPAFSLVGARSLGAYLWNVLVEAGQELKIVPAGYATVERLETGVS
ncbi:MAG: hypothetical protein O2954_17395 [bacterium]|nr:hypothetical protein [bacterium]